MSIGDKFIKFSNVSTRGKHWASTLAFQDKKEREGLRSTYPQAKMLEIAVAIGEGRETLGVISKRFEVPEVTIRSWLKKKPIFAKKVAQVRDEMKAALIHIPLANAVTRAEKAQRDHDRIEELESELVKAAEDPTNPLFHDENGLPVVGAATGLLSKRIKGKGEVEFVFNDAIVSRKAALRESVAVEVGDRDKEKVNIGPVKVEICYIEGPLHAEDPGVVVDIVPGPAEISAADNNSSNATNQPS